MESDDDFRDTAFLLATLEQHPWISDSEDSVIMQRKVQSSQSVQTWHLAAVTFESFLLQEWTCAVQRAVQQPEHCYFTYVLLGPLGV